ncbi:phospholipase D-like domain-containing protein [Kitasatospora sp. GAS1066B]|uniref:phospholipase D-like domain-containing protein n=1 Tax=Kitasatospora sp. GAS1066B TaxID=3156271 RepID=UPI0035133925
MFSRRGHRLRPLTPSALALAAVLAAQAATPASASVSRPVRSFSSTTPHLDAIQQTLHQVSPGLEGSAWQRTSGNNLDTTAGDPTGWLLQTPGCWGDATCSQRPGTQRLLAKTTENIAHATRTVDVSTLAPFPDGPFEDAIVTGLKAAAEAGSTLQVRILVGAAPIAHATVLPSAYRDELVRKLGRAAARITLNVASMTTAKTALSWNHSKLLVVDGRSVITGGINSWTGDYINTAHPVTDVDLALVGPAASSAGAYLDTLWTWTCRNTGIFSAAWFASSNGAACQPTLEKDRNPTPAPPAGDVPVIAIGGLGVGIKDVDPTSTYRPLPPLATDSRCGPITLHDNTNQDRDYETVNPEESALRALIASATSHIEISQQDLNGLCPPLPRYDIRLYDLLAAKLAAGVKVRIVVSTPDSGGSFGSGYSNMKSLTEITDLLRNRLTAITAHASSANAAMCQNLQLAPLRAAADPTWADGHSYALHTKLVSVDSSAFYIGSKNLYPVWLQDFGYIVEAPAAASQLDAVLLTPQWQYSQAAATVDYKRGICSA